MGGPTGMQQACLLRCFWPLPVNSLPWGVAQGHCGMGHITYDPTRKVKEFLTAGCCRVLQRLGMGGRDVGGRGAGQRDTASEAQPSVPAEAWQASTIWDIVSSSQL